MDIPISLTIPQFVLTLSLFTLLIGWLIIFAYLALRPLSEKPAELMDHTTTLPVRKSPTIQTLPIPPRTIDIHTVTEQTPIITVSVDSTREMVLDHSQH